MPRSSRSAGGVVRWGLGFLVLTAVVFWVVVGVARQRRLDVPPWRSTPLARRTETQPATSSVIRDRHGRLLAEPVLARDSSGRARVVVERPYGRCMGVVGVGRTMVQPIGLQGNLSGVNRAGGLSLRPYESGNPVLRFLLGDRLLTSPPQAEIITTLDAELCKWIYGELDRIGRPSSVVVMNAKSGELVAVVSWPGPDVDSDKAPDGRTSVHAILAGNLPASTMKTLSAAFLLSASPASARAVHVCSGDRCWARHGPVRGISQAYSRSCNSWFRANVQQQQPAFDSEAWKRFLFRVGLGAPAGPGLPTSGITFAGDRKGQFVWEMAVGQRVWCSLTDLAGAYATVVHPDGRRVVPVIVQSADGRALRSPSSLQVVDAKVTRVVRSLLYENAQVGTARGLNRSYRGPGKAAGKTGTGEREGRRSDAVFVAVAPGTDPRWVVVVSVRGGGHGSALAFFAGRILNEVNRRAEVAG